MEFQRWDVSFNPRHTRGGGAPRMVFPELLKNGGAQRRQILAMLLYIQGGPDDVLKIFGSGQVTDMWRHSQTSARSNMIKMVDNPWTKRPGESN